MIAMDFIENISGQNLRNVEISIEGSFQLRDVSRRETRVLALSLTSFHKFRCYRAFQMAIPLLVWSTNKSHDLDSYLLLSMPHCQNIPYTYRVYHIDDIFLFQIP
jgi:hypothetical protein